MRHPTETQEANWDKDYCVPQTRTGEFVFKGLMWVSGVLLIVLYGSILYPMIVDVIRLVI